MGAVGADYVYLLPFTIRKQIAAILDRDDEWESLAFVMEGIGNSDVQACRDARAFESPTENLLAIWGSKGNTTVQLYNCLARAKLVRAMKVVSHLVDPCYHHWEQECLQSTSKTTENDGESVASHFNCSVQAHEDHGSENSDDAQHCFDEMSSLKPTSSMWLNLVNDRSTSSNSLYKTLENTPCVKYDEIMLITHNFSESSIIGSGGFGTVYKAVWEQTEVAVKRIHGTKGVTEVTFKEHLRQSLQELKTLSKYRHDNILPLYAYSLDGPHPCLLYQYMSNGSLFDCLFGKKHTLLTWLQRMSVMIGCARGLHYLHSVAKTPIIHGDVKSANILLDKYMEPKLGDFGLCRDNFSEDKWKMDDFVITSRIKGTLAYLPEEFLSEGIISTKLDVYGYGVVALEIATGLKPFEVTRNPQNIVEYAKNWNRSEKYGNVSADRLCSFVDGY
ncbi:unnamed protein product [Thelazia callipaeda]|uniref:non-specific serine/threonine protein kinase n=1 Tax=Thelazia callipaeda TaxID=103827 RepID=A0A0N5D546_THECL|nr:unnamed protein product [Thelazia callipaeda]